MGAASVMFVQQPQLSPRIRNGVTRYNQINATHGKGYSTDPCVLVGTLYTVEIPISTNCNDGSVAYLFLLSHKNKFTAIWYKVETGDFPGHLICATNTQII